jgi:acyl carrier protein
MDREAFYQDLRAFIATANAGAGQEPEPCFAGPDDNLFDEGLINSFTVVQLMVHLEQVTGSRLNPAGFDIESFSTLRKLYSVVDGLRGSDATA